MSQPAALTLRRPRPARPLISLVAMIDVLLILLVFFMVTSTYLDLDMIPAVSQDGDASGAPAQETAVPVLIRIGADGAPVIRGQALSLGELEARLEARVSETAALSVMLLPTGVAKAQSLVSVMDVATRAGVTNLRVIRLEARP